MSNGPARSEQADWRAALLRQPDVRYTLGGTVSSYCDSEGVRFVHLVHHITEILVRSNAPSFTVENGPGNIAPVVVANPLWFPLGLLSSDDVAFISHNDLHESTHDSADSLATNAFPRIMHTKASV
jgi:hypothetical protein